MMSIQGEGAERLAEIFREIFALSEANRPNDSKSPMVNDATKSSDTQDARGASEASARRAKQAGGEHGEAENQQVRQ